MEEDDIPQFAARIKEKFPEYKDLDDADLVERIVRKHPSYASKVKLPEGFRLLQTTTGYKNLDDVYEEAGRANDVDPNLLLEQGRQETINFKPDVMYGRQASPKKAVGAGQFMEGTAPQYGLVVNDTQDDRKDPIKSIHAQARYMRKLLDQFGNDETLALAGYNAGEARPALQAGQVPNFPETQNYVKTIGGALQQIRSGPGTLKGLLGAVQTGTAEAPPTMPQPSAPATAEAPAAGGEEPVSHDAALTTSDAPLSAAGKPFYDPKDVDPAVVKSALLDQRKQLSEELARAKTPVRRNIIIGRLKKVDGDLIQANQVVRARANAAQPAETQPADVDKEAAIANQQIAKQSQAKAAKVQQLLKPVEKPKGQYDFQRTGKLALPAVMGESGPETFRYEKNPDIEKNGEYRFLDADNTPYIYSPSSGKVVPEEDKTVLRDIDVPLGEKGSDVRTVKATQGSAIASGIADLLPNVPQKDIADFFAERGLSHFDTQKDLTDPEYTKGFVNPVTGTTDTPTTEKYHVTQRGLNQIEAYSQEKQDQRKKYDDAVKQSVSEGDDPFTADISARVATGQISAKKGDEIIAAQRPDSLENQSALRKQAKAELRQEHENTIGGDSANRQVFGMGDYAPSEDEIAAKIKELSDPETISSRARVQKDAADIAGNLKQEGLVGQAKLGLQAVGGQFEALAGAVLRPFSSVPGLSDLYKTASEKSQSRTMAFEQGADDTKWGFVFRHGVKVAGDLLELGLLHKVPGLGEMPVTFAAQGAATTYGQGGKLNDVVKSGAGGYVLGKIFDGASAAETAVKNYGAKAAVTAEVGENPFLQKVWDGLSQEEKDAQIKLMKDTTMSAAEKRTLMLDNIVGKYAGGAVLAAGTGLQGKAEGKSNGSIAEETATNLLFHFGPGIIKGAVDLTSKGYAVVRGKSTLTPEALDKIAGRVARVWEDGEPHDYFVNAKGQLNETARPVPQGLVEIEAVADPKNPVYKKQMQDKSSAEAKTGPPAAEQSAAGDGFDVTHKDGGRFKVLEDRGKQLLVEDEKGSTTLQPERKFTDLDQFREASAKAEPVPAEASKKTETPEKPKTASNDGEKSATVTQTDEQKAIQDEKASESDPAPGSVHKFSSTQVDLPDALSREVLKVGKSIIPDSELYTDPEDPSYGREDQPHVTVKYGLHTSDAAEVSKLLKDQPPVKVKLGKISIFEGGSTDREERTFDVVKAEVDSPDLHRLNGIIAKGTKVTDTFPDYKPHVTLAYVKKGEGAKYVGRTDLEGKEVTVNSITFSNKNGGTVDMPLGGKSVADLPTNKESQQTSESDAKIAAKADLQSNETEPEGQTEKASWQIPQSEWMDHGVIHEGKITDIGAGRGKKISSLSAEPFGKSKPLDVPPREAGAESVIKGLHKVSVANAIERGEKVPADVLKDYPDLAKQYGDEGTADKRKEAKRLLALHPDDIRPEAKDIAAGEESHKYLEGRNRKDIVKQRTYFKRELTRSTKELTKAQAEVRSGDYDATHIAPIEKDIRFYKSSIEALNNIVDRQTGKTSKPVSDSEPAPKRRGFTFGKTADVSTEPANAKAEIKDGNYGTVGFDGHSVTIFPNKHLSEKGREVEQRTVAEVQADPKGFVDRYIQKFGGKIVDTDNARELFKEYTDDKLKNTDAVQAAAAAVAKLTFQKRLAELPKDSSVLLTAGGPASGKSSTVAKHNFDLVYDSVMAGRDANEDLIGQVIDAGHTPSIYYTHRPIDRAVIGMLHRLRETGRPVGLRIMAGGHFYAQKAFLEHTDAYARSQGVPIRYFEFTESGNVREINLKVLRNRAYSNLEKVQQKADNALNVEFKHNKYEASIVDHFTKGDLEADGGPRSSSSSEEPEQDQGLSETAAEGAGRRLRTEASEGRTGGGSASGSRDGLLDETNDKDDGSGSLKQSRTPADDRSGVRSVQPTGDRAGSPDDVRTRSAGTSTKEKARVSDLGFYSAVEQTILDKMPERASAEQVKNILSPQKSAGVKQAELDWLGVDQFLKDNPNSTKNEVLDFVRANNARVTEVMKGGAWDKAYDRAIKHLTETEGLSEDDAFRYVDDAMLDDLTPGQLKNQTPATKEVLGDLTAIKPEPTKYGKYSLPGGENYRELLLTMPPKPLPDNLRIVREGLYRTPANEHISIGKSWKAAAIDDKGIIRALTSEEDIEAGLRRSMYGADGNYKSRHFDEPNVLAHVRFDTRDGGKTLHIAEIQSDWHQAGRAKGYKPSPAEIARLEARESVLQKSARPEDLAELVEVRRELAEGPMREAPDGPFKKNWHDLAMKRIIRYAAENGFERVTWDTGETQSDRFDLSKQVDSVRWQKITADGYRLEIYKGGQDLGETLRIPAVISADKIGDYIGKDARDQIIASPDRSGTLKGDQLKVGGRGMKGFYDEMLPESVGKYVKKWGAKPYLDELDAGGEKTIVHAVDITPEMRDSVLKDGQPLFRKRDAGTEAAIDQVEGADLGQLISKVKESDVARDGYRVETKTPEAYEIVRSAVEENELRKGNEDPMRYDALYLEPKDAAAVVKILRDGAKDAAAAGAGAKDAAKLESIATSIEDAAAEGNGSAIVYLFDDAVPHEDVHKWGYENAKAVDRRLAERHSPEALDQHDSSPVVTKLKDGAFQKLYPNASKAVRVEEAAAWLIGGGRERLNEMNREMGKPEISEEEAADFVTDWVMTYRDKNPDANLDEFAKINDYANEITERTNQLLAQDPNKETGRPSEIDREPQDPDGNKGDGVEEPPGERSEGTAGSAAADATGSEPGQLKERQTVVSAEKAGVVEEGSITGDSRYYTEKSRDANVRDAQERIQDMGLAHAEIEAKTGIPVEGKRAEHKALQMETVKLLNAQADQAMVHADLAMAKAKLYSAQEIVAAMAEQGTDYGQAISQLAAWQKTDPDAVAGYVQKRRAQSGYHKPLTPEESSILRQDATELQDLNAKIEELNQKVADLEQQNAKAKGPKLNPVRREVSKTLQKDASDALERLKGKFAFDAGTSASETLKMARPLAEMRAAQIPDEDMKDFVKIGADILDRGVEGKPMSKIHFDNSLAEIFGDDIRPHAAEIFGKSVIELRRQRSEAYRNRAVEALRNIEGNEDLTVEDLKAIVEQTLAERKEAAKVRGEQTRAANYEKNKGEIERKLSIKPGFAKSLFKVFRTENKEVLVGALFLETAQVTSADELARKLREIFPQLTSKEALNAASLAARSRELAHQDLRAERAALGKEKTDAELMRAEIKRKRNEAQRKLLNRIKYLEGPPPGYMKRVARLYKAALVGAVQTTVNNVLTAEATRKMVAVGDLAEVLINRVLAKAGKEYDYDGKLGSRTRLRDVMGIPQSEKYSVAETVKHFFSDAVFARGISNTVLDEFPTVFEDMFGSYASDIAVLRDTHGPRGYTDKALQVVENAYEGINYLNYLQEFLVRSQEFNHALQMKLGARGLNLADIVRDERIVEDVSPDDLVFAVNRALEVTFALRPDKDTLSGSLLSEYQKRVPAIVAPLGITFPNFLYNGLRFTTNFAPGVGIAKALTKAVRSKDSFRDALAQEVNPRVVAQQLVGTALYLGALGLVRAAGDDDKWYLLRTPFTNPEGKNYYIDVRSYQPFSSILFLANKTNRALNGKPMFSDADTAKGEIMEALVGLSTKNLSENKLLGIIADSTFGSGQEDGKDWDRVAYLAKQQLGEIGGGFLRPLKTVKDLVAQFDAFEAKQPDLIDSPGLQGIARSLPFSNRILSKVAGTETRKDFVTDREFSQPASGLKLLGVNIVDPAQHKEIPSSALVMAREMGDARKPERDILPTSQRAAAAKLSIYKSMRDAGDDPEKLAQVDAAIKRAESDGLLRPGQLEYISRAKGMSELESLSKGLEYEKLQRVYNVASDSEKAVIEPILEDKRENREKEMENAEFDRLKESVRHGETSIEEVDKQLSKQLEDGKITAVQYKERLKSMYVTDAEEEVGKINATSNSDFRKIENLVKSTAPADRESVKTKLLEKVAAKLKSKDLKSVEEARRLMEVIDRLFPKL